MRSTRSRTADASAQLLQNDSLKRKSSDGDDSENRSPNLKDKREDAKRLRTVDKKDTKKSSSMLKTRSALPRYNATSSVAEAKKGRTAVAPKSKTIERSQTTPMRTRPNMSPPRSQSSVSKAPSSALRSAGSHRKVRKSVLLRCTTTGRIKGLFENAAISNEEQINEIIVPKLKVKCKWDYRDKAKRQAEVISDLRSALKTTSSEFKELQAKCETAEKEMDDTLYAIRSELDEKRSENSDLRKNESQLKRDYIRLSNDYNSCHSKLKTVEAELHNSNTELEAQKCLVQDVKDELSATKSQQLQTERDLQECRERLAELEKQKSELSSSMDGHIDKAVSTYKSENATLLADLDKERTALKAALSEIETLKEKALLDKETISELQLELRDKNGASQQYKNEADKLIADISELKQQLVQKDTDLRTTLVSMQEFQRHYANEKSALSDELSALRPRLQKLEEQRVEDKEDLASKKEELSSSLKELNHLREALQSAQALVTEKDKELLQNKDAMLQLGVEREIRTRAEMREESERTERIAACAQLLATQTDCANQMKELREKMAANAEAHQVELLKCISTRDEEISKNAGYLERIEVLEGELKQCQHALEHAEANHEAVTELGRVKGEVVSLKRRIAEMNEHKASEESASIGRIRELELKLAAGDEQRRKLHNLVQELRGNVRVFARVRPFLPSDEGIDPMAPPESTIVTRHDNSGLRICKKATKPNEKPEEHGFMFDKVFGQSASQDHVFQEVSEFVQSALDGYNVCLFSYGQTGSGKTHTMQGSGDGPMRGIIPRAVQQVGKYKYAQEEKGWEYTMEVSFVEIYNEVIKDLLRENNDPNVKHDIKKDASGNTYVSDVTMMTIDPNNSEQLDQVMQFAARHRSVGHTAMNAQSSRSHSIFTLYIKAKNPSEGIVLKGALNLVDLAGSERLDRSGATGSTMKETLAINKSLSSLTDVFVAIANKQAHIPFRNSKLTHLLQPSLSGDGKALMMVNLSPTEQSYFESLCSLRFASQVNQCELGKPKRYLKEANGSQTTSTSQSTKSVTKLPSRGVKTMRTK